MIVNRYALMAIALTASAMLFAGCGQDDSGSTTTTTTQVSPISEDARAKLKPGMSKEQAIEAAGVDPVLTQGPTDDFPEGCVFFAMENAPTSNVLQVCFSDQGLGLIVTSFSDEQPAPPEGASPTRAALLARADSICQSEYGLLHGITGDLGEALDAFGGDPSTPRRNEVDRQIGRFIGNLDDTHAQLAAFAAPDDGIETLTAYLEALDSQIEVLRGARRAFSEGDLGAYDRLGTKFTQVGEDAKERAKDYGFSYCSASGWA